MREEGERAEPSRLMLLCQNERGYANLTRLVTRGLPRRPGAARSHAASAPGSTRDTTNGLIALSGAREGDVGRALLAGRDDEARARAGRAGCALFGDRYYLELQRTGRPGEEDCIAAVAARSRPARRAGGRDQRRALPRARRLRGARGARLHPRGRAARRSRAAAPLQRRAVPALARGDGGAVRRPARGAREQRSRSRGAATWQLHARQAARCRSSRCRPARTHRGLPARASRSAGLDGAPAVQLAATSGRVGDRGRATTRASRASSTSSARWASPATS